MLDLALDNRIEIYNPLDAAIQEIDLLFNTENTELIGYPEYGINFEQFLWILTPTTSEFEDYINQKLSTLYYLGMYQYQAKVEFAPGEIRSIYRIMIDIYISDEEKITKEYEFR